MTTHQHWDPDAACAYIHDHPVHGGNHQHGRLERIGLEKTGVRHADPKLNVQYQGLTKLIRHSEETAHDHEVAGREARKLAELLKEVRHAIIA